MQISIEPYNKCYHTSLVDLESEAIQGGSINLRMVKPSIDSRANVFKEYQIFLALTHTGEVAGVTSAAISEIEVNDQLYTALTIFDSRVGLKYRGNRIAHKLVQETLRYYSKLGVKYYYITLKENNQRVRSIIHTKYNHVSIVPFTYLTVPTSSRIRKLMTGQLARFSVTKFNGFPNKDLIRCYGSVNIFDTYKMYSLEIAEAPFYLDVVLRIHNMIRSQKKLPLSRHPIRMATLFNNQLPDLEDLNQAMDDLQSDKVGFMNVCCQLGDMNYSTFKPYAISSYKYYLALSLDVNNIETLKLDVRCL